MIDWEDILNEFLEGGLMRADVEALRWKIQLPTEARVVMDRDLKLVDDLGAAGGTMMPGVEQVRQAVTRIGWAMGREDEVEMPGHWRWQAGVPTAGRMDDAEAVEYAELARRLTEAGRSMPIADGALERLLNRIREIELPGELDARANEESGAMRLYPAGEELNLDALAASKDVLPAETLPGADEPKKPE